MDLGLSSLCHFLAGLVLCASRAAGAGQVHCGQSLARRAGETQGRRSRQGHGGTGQVEGWRTVRKPCIWTQRWGRREQAASGAMARGCAEVLASVSGLAVERGVICVAGILEADLIGQELKVRPRAVAVCVEKDQVLECWEPQ